MKRTGITTFVLAGGLALTGLPSLAENPPRRESVRQAQLERRSQDLARRLHTGSKLGALREVELRRQQRAIDDLIRKLEAGEAVPPGEVERLLQAP
jgi:hypothetical protein